MNPQQEMRKPLDKLRSQDLRAIALYTLGNGLLDIRELTSVKGQTFRKKVRAVFNAGLWTELLGMLNESSFAFDEDGLAYLLTEFKQDAKGQPSFRRVGQARKE